jgi:hypothetical protein
VIQSFWGTNGLLLSYNPLITSGTSLIELAVKTGDSTTTGRKEQDMTSFDQNHSHGAPRESLARPDRAEQITDDSARGGLLGGRPQLLVMLLAALAMAIAGVGTAMVWSR